MRRILSGLSVFFVLAAFLFANFNLTQSAASSTLIIKELMPDPVGDDGLYEWIELQNVSSVQIQLSNYKLNTVKLPSAVILPGEIFIVAKNSSYILSRYPELTTNIYNTTFSLANSGATINLTDNTDNILSTFSYGQSQEGKSFELLEGTCGSIVINQTASSNSIGKINSSCIAPTSPASTGAITTPFITDTISVFDYSNLIEIYQIKPCADNESVVLTNHDSYSINLSGWRIEADEKKMAYLSGIQIKSKNQTVVMFESNFFNDGGGSVSLIDPLGNQKDIFSYSKCINENNIFKIFANDNSALINKNAFQCKESNLNQDLQYPGIYDFRE